MKDYLTDSRISLRKYRPDDAFALYEAVSESIADLSLWGFYRLGFTLNDAEEEVLSYISDWDQGKNYTFLIEEPLGAAFVGNCRIEEIERASKHASLGWWVRTSRTHQGIATAAGRLAANAAFEALHFPSLRIYTNAKNMASRRVAEKMGAKLDRIKAEENEVFCAIYKLKPADLHSENKPG
jgi:ribosomal-protein-serine acetyltransferase